MTMTAPPSFSKSPLLADTYCPITDAEAPMATKTSVKPRMNARDARITRRRTCGGAAVATATVPCADVPRISSSESPEMKER